MKLFQILDTSTRKVVPGAHFSDKEQAKRKRKELNPRDESGQEIMLHVVTYGPDHRKFRH